METYVGLASKGSLQPVPPPLGDKIPRQIRQRLVSNPMVQGNGELLTKTKIRARAKAKAKAKAKARARARARAKAKANERGQAPQLGQSGKRQKLPAYPVNP